MIINGLGTAAESDVGDFISSSAAAASITTTNISNWNSAFSWGDHSAAGYVQLISDALVIGDTVLPDFGYDEKLVIKGSGSGAAGRAMGVFQNTNTSSGCGLLLANSDNTKRLLMQVTNSGYTLPNFSSIATNGGMNFYFITDGHVASGGTSDIFFRLGGYDSTADAFCFHSSKRLGIGGVNNPTYDISFSGNAAKTIWMERNTVANTAGNNLSVFAGGATVGATNKNGGSLLLRSGASTGSGESGVKIQTAFAGASGTADSYSTNVMIEALGNKLAFNGATPVTKPTVTGSRGGNAALASLLTALAQLGLITDSTTA